MCLPSHVREADKGLIWQHAFHPQDISVKTKEILTNLVALADECEDSKITLEGLKQHHFPPVTENFLFHLAAAEQLLRIWCCSEKVGRMDSGWAVVERLCCRCGDNCCFLNSPCSPYADNTPDACVPERWQIISLPICVCTLVLLHSNPFTARALWLPKQNASSGTFSKYIHMEKIARWHNNQSVWHLSNKNGSTHDRVTKIQTKMGMLGTNGTRFVFFCGSQCEFVFSFLTEPLRFGGGRRPYVAKPINLRCIIKAAVAVHVHKTVSQNFRNPSSFHLLLRHIAYQRNSFEQSTQSNWIFM